MVAVVPSRFSSSSSPSSSPNSPPTQGGLRRRQVLHELRLPEGLRGLREGTPP